MEPLVDAPVWIAVQAADRLRDPAVLDELLDAPALVLDLRHGDGDPQSLQRIPCPVIALTSTGTATSWAPDLVLEEASADALLVADDLEQAVAVLVGAAQANPAAAGVLVQVLRTTAGQPVEQALLVESTAYSLLLSGPEFWGWLDRRAVPRPAQDQGPAVVVHREGALLELSLDRPSVRNAYDAAMRDELVEALSLALLDSSIERVVLRGNGPAFCSGGDLRDFGRSEDLVRAHGIRTTRHPGALLHALAGRIEVHVHGACVGAGVELPAFADRVVARADAWFRLPELSLGLIPGAGGTVSLPRRIGASRTLLLALSGIDLRAHDALRWGLVDAVVEEPGESDVSV